MKKLIYILAIFSSQICLGQSLDSNNVWISLDYIDCASKRTCDSTLYPVIYIENPFTKDCEVHTYMAKLYPNPMSSDNAQINHLKYRVNLKYYDWNLPDRFDSTIVDVYHEGKYLYLRDIYQNDTTIYPFTNNINGLFFF